jgi:hypothetical protein
MTLRNHIDGLVKILKANPSLEHVEVCFRLSKKKSYKKGIIVLDQELENVKFFRESIL